MNFGMRNAQLSSESTAIRDPLVRIRRRRLENDSNR